MMRTNSRGRGSPVGSPVVAAGRQPGLPGLAFVLPEPLCMGLAPCQGLQVSPEMPSLSYC